jgi:hypothetical protein
MATNINDVTGDLTCVICTVTCLRQGNKNSASTSGCTCGAARPCMATHVM